MGEGKWSIIRQPGLITLNRPAARLLGADYVASQDRSIQEVVRDPQLQSFITRTIFAREPIEGEVVLQAVVQDTLATITVSDTGPGIAGENLHKVFDTFWQADQSLTREAGGTGLGLSIARAIALDPEVLFFDEPSAGLDPINSHRLDDLILALRDSLGTTVVAVTHELPSIFAIGNNSIFLDAESKTAIASGDPKELLAHCENPKVREFLTRGEGRPGE